MGQEREGQGRQEASALNAIGSIGGEGGRATASPTEPLRAVYKEWVLGNKTAAGCQLEPRAFVRVRGGGGVNKDRAEHTPLLEMHHAR